VACRTARPKQELRRIVRTPDGLIVDDPTGKLSGRGAYVCPDKDCLSIAIKKGALARALETPLPPSFVEEFGSGAAPTHTTEGGPRGKE
jgi:predicted RNA-binding protein YlxR (DUF448 family)